MTHSTPAIAEERTPLLATPRNQPHREIIRDSQEENRWTLDNSARRLYVSHSLSACNNRIFEFGSVFVLGFHLPRHASAHVVLSSLVGQYIDREDRLKVVRLSIVLQRASVAASCIVFFVLGRAQHTAQALRASLLALLAVMACVEKLAAMMNVVAVERDWLFGPFFIGVIVDDIATETAILVNLGMNCVSVVEYYSIAKVCYLEALGLVLQQPKTAPSLVLAPGQNSSRPVKKEVEDTVSYFRHPVFMASFAGTLLYFTLLAFSGQTVTYLLATGFTPTQIAATRTVSVIFEVFATWVGPWLMAKIGPVRAGLWFSSWQVSCLAVGMSIYWRYGDDNSLISTSGLVGGIMLSRVGLWGFDLSVQIIVQEEVEAETRGAFSAVEASGQNVFEMCSYTLTIVLSSPSQFRWPATISVGAVLCAWALYTRFVIRRRGHLIHWPACISHPEKRQRSTEDLLHGVARGRRG
ncbi:hypothetical protein EDB81DRAFT_839257 [Dactylonectria macrodidyma]|uniref:Solute carrier family 40 member n=1 Tax=Dactylonectria macrodidyma TaxID=307937 RepID=A0A9P9FFA0_9HYPO|nr:hypothetical protein EDB81DRAFT_839257 [Dactylonectria macrodidyma]